MIDNFVIERINGITATLIGDTIGLTPIPEKCTPYHYEFICPNCGNGSHGDGTGAVANFKSGKWLWCCQRGHDFDGDNITILAAHYGLDTSGGDFPKLIRRICEDFGEEYGETAEEVERAVAKIRKEAKPASNVDFRELQAWVQKFHPEDTTILEIIDEVVAAEEKISVPSSTADTCATKEQALIQADIETARANLDNLPENDRRGLTLETLQKFGCGYLEDWTPPNVRAAGKSVTPSRRLITPADCGYGAICIDRAIVDKQYWKQRGGQVGLFGLDLLPLNPSVIVAVEGEIDAMSLAQVESVNVVATCGAGNIDLLVSGLNKKFAGVDKPRVIVLLDSDETGRSKAPEMTAALIAAGYPAVAKFLSQEVTKLDANDILREAGESKLAEIVKRIVDEAQEEFPAHEEKISVPSSTAKSSRAKNRAKASAAAKPGGDEKPKRERIKEKIPSCPIDIELPLNHHVNKSGALWLVTSKGSFSIVNVAVVVTKNFKAGDDFASESVELAVYDRLSDSWHKHIVPKKTIADNKKILDLVNFGIDIVQSKAKYLSVFLMEMLNCGENYRIIPIRYVYSQSGWLGEGCKNFLYPNSESVIGDGSVQADVYRPTFNYKRAYSAIGEKTAWVEMYMHVLSGKSLVARVQFGAALAAPILKLLGIQNQWFHLSCPSGNGKSAVQKFALSIYGNPQELTKKFNSTTNFLETTSLIFNDLPHGIEEFQTAKKVDRESIDSAVYDFNDGRTRGRNNRDGDAKPLQYFSGVILSSGEQTLTRDNSGAGVFKRVVELTDADILPNGLAVELHRFCRRNYGLFGRDWIRAIIDNAAEIKSSFETLRATLQEQFPAAYPNHIDAIAAVYTAGKFFERHVLSRYELETENPLTPFDDRWFDLDFSKIFAQLPDQMATKNGERAIAAVAEFITRYRAYFRTLDSSGNAVDDSGRDNPTNEVYGYLTAIEEEEVVAIFPRIVRDNVLNQFPSAAACLREMNDSGYLVTGKSKARPHYKLVEVDNNGGVQKIWLCCFKVAKLNG